MSTIRNYAELAAKAQGWHEWAQRQSACLDEPGSISQTKYGQDQVDLANNRRNLANFERNAEDCLLYLHPSEVAQAEQIISHTVAEVQVFHDKWDEYLLTHQPVPDPEPVVARPPVPAQQFTLATFFGCASIFFLLIAFACGAILESTPNAASDGGHSAAHAQVGVLIGLLIGLMFAAMYGVAKLDQKVPGAKWLFGAAAAADIAYRHHERREQAHMTNAMRDALNSQQGPFGPSYEGQQPPYGPTYGGS